MVEGRAIPGQAQGDGRVNAAAESEAKRIAEDLRLVAEYATGNELALRRFADRMLCVPRILSALNSKMGRPLNAHDIEDLTQQTLLIVLRKLNEYRGLSSIEGWAYRICYFEFANGARRKSRESRRRTSHEVSGEAASLPTTPSCQHEDLHRALDRLPAEEQAVIHLKHFCGMTFDSISKQLSAKLSTVKARYYRGISFLRQVEELDQG